MLNNITNFFNLLTNRRIKTTIEPCDLIALGVYDPRTPGIYQPAAISISSLTSAQQSTGLLIDFQLQKIFNTATIPGIGEITNDLTNAKLGIVQKIYHNSLIAPSMPAGWVLVGGGIYVPGVLNIINAEWCGGTRVEYWVTQ